MQEESHAFSDYWRKYSPLRCLSSRFLQKYTKSPGESDNIAKSHSNMTLSIRSNFSTTIIKNDGVEFSSRTVGEADISMAKRKSFCDDAEHDAISNDRQGASESTNSTRLHRGGHETRSTVSTCTDSISDHVNDKLSLIAPSDRARLWLSAFRRTDPRYKILRFFDDIAHEGANNVKHDEFRPEVVPSVLKPFYKASVFTVWRPTSYAAIRKMMTGEAVGKGLDIKGKSSKSGIFSGFVPFLQIHEEKDKQRVSTRSRDAKIRIFFDSEHARNLVLEKLEVLRDEMFCAVREAKEGLKSDVPFEEKVIFTERLRWDMSDSSIDKVDDYAPESCGLDVPERLFWEGYVARQDISRPDGSAYDSGRPSEPNFQDMNIVSLRGKPRKDHPRAVLMQRSVDNPMCPQCLLMAYEEAGRVLPVVSDFDCFLTGTSGVKYNEPFAPEQLAVMNWCVSKIEDILSEDKEDPWTNRWLDKLKVSAANGYNPKSPEYGFADPKSYSIMETGIKRLQSCSGPVRHGAESFNYYFPQQLDETYLVISDNFSENSLPWQYVSANGLQEILLEKIDEGFTFPLNPKWILCDPGWKRVYDKLLSSKKPNVQDSLDIWYPLPIREKIENIHQMHPKGFKLMAAISDNSMIEEEPDDAGTYLVSNAEHELKRYMTLRRAKLKLRTAVKMMHMTKQEQEDKDECLSIV